MKADRRHISILKILPLLPRYITRNHAMIQKLGPRLNESIFGLLAVDIEKEDDGGLSARARRHIEANTKSISIAYILTAILFAGVLKYL